MHIPMLRDWLSVLSLLLATLMTQFLLIVNDGVLSRIRMLFSSCTLLITPLTQTPSLVKTNLKPPGGLFISRMFEVGRRGLYRGEII